MEEGCRFVEMTECPFYARCSEGKPCMYDEYVMEDFEEYANIQDRG